MLVCVHMCSCIYVCMPVYTYTIKHVCMHAHAIVYVNTCISGGFCPGVFPIPNLFAVTKMSVGHCYRGFSVQQSMITLTFPSLSPVL